MNEISIFTNPEFGKIRTVTLNGEPWFVGKDVAEALGYGKGKSLNNAIASHVDREDKGVTEMMTPGGQQKITIINESGLYSLILSSKLSGAKAFKRWVTAEVLPQLRRTGTYGNINLEEVITKTAVAVVSEMMKNLTPLLHSDPIGELRYMEMTTPKPQRKRAPGTISKLDDEIKQTVCEMLSTDRYSYGDVQKYLATFGVHVSQTTIWRYSKRLYG